MILHIALLALGLGLLWLPRGWLRLGKPEGGGSKRRATKATGGPNRDRMPGDRSVWLGEEIVRRRNWLDLGRGIVGGMAVMSHTGPVVEALVNVPGMDLARPILITEAVLLLAGVVLQMIRMEERLTLFPPLFYVMGLTFPIAGWKAGLWAFGAIWAVNVVLPNPAIFLAAYAGLAAILTITLGNGVKPAVLIALLAATPPLVATLFRRRLAQFRKRTKIVVR